MTYRFYKLDKELMARRDLGSSAKVVYSVLADSIGDNGYSWLGIRGIAERAGIGVATVRRALGQLENEHIEIEKQGSGRASHYRLKARSNRNTQARSERNTQARPKRNTKRAQNGTPERAQNGTLARPKRNVLRPNKRPNKNNTPKQALKDEEKRDPKFEDLVVETWNAQSGLRPIRRLTEKRRQQLQVRLKDDDWRANVIDGIKSLGRVPFACGKNDRGWHATIDWLISNDTNLTKAIEWSVDLKPAKKVTLIRGDMNTDSDIARERAEWAATKARIKALSDATKKLPPKRITELTALARERANEFVLRNVGDASIVECEPLRVLVRDEILNGEF